MFWFSHQRRLAYQPHATRRVVYLNLVFLLIIILLPVTTGLYGTYGNARDIIVLYSCHLTALAGLSGILWLLAGLTRGEPNVAIPMAFSTTVFSLSVLFALVIPQTSIPQVLWYCGFASPLIEQFLENRRRRQAARLRSMSACQPTFTTKSAMRKSRTRAVPKKSTHRATVG
jgi:TMEM175 potassium channel family protein